MCRDREKDEGTLFYLTLQGTQFFPENVRRLIVLSLGLFELETTKKQTGTHVRDARLADRPSSSSYLVRRSLLRAQQCHSRFEDTVHVLAQLLVQSRLHFSGHINAWKVFVHDLDDVVLVAKQ